MIRIYPTIIQFFFKKYKNPKQKVKSNTVKLSNQNKVYKNRDNTTNILNEKSAQLLEKYLQYVPSENIVVKDDVKNISDVDITNALIRWGLKELIFTKPTKKYESKTERMNIRQKARSRKNILQNYEYENGYENKESNLEQMVAQIEMQDKANQDEKISEFFVLLWVVFNKVLEIYRQIPKQKKEEKYLQEMADKYFKSGAIADERFAKKIDSEKQIDLMDLYELNHKNINVVINTVNQRNR